MNGKMWYRGPLLLVTLAIIIIVEGGEFQKPQLGGSIPVVADYQHLDEYMMNIIRRPDDVVSTSHPTAFNVFKNVLSLPDPPKVKGKSMFRNRNVEVHLCPDIDTLLRKYFNKIKIAGLDKVWYALNQDWSTNAMAQRFGIDASYLIGNYSYALLRVKRRRDKKEIAGSPDDLQLKEESIKTIEDELYYGNNTGLAEILKKHGSHYITSFVTGNSVYQVFVYEPPFYNFLKLELDTRGFSNLSTLELEIFFSPWLAVHVGKILSPSGDRSVEVWAAENLQTPNTPFWIERGAEIHSASGYSSVEAWAAENLRNPFSSASLMELYKNESLREELSILLKEEAVLELRLNPVSPFFEDLTFRDWFEMHIYDRLKEIEP